MQRLETQLMSEDGTRLEGHMTTGEASTLIEHAGPQSADEDADHAQVCMAFGSSSRVLQVRQELSHQHGRREVEGHTPPGIQDGDNELPSEVVDVVAKEAACG